MVDPQPLFVMDLLSGLGFGEQMIVGATLILTALYLFKGKKAAGMFVGLMGTVWLAATSIAIAAAVAIILGWVDPIPGRFFADLWTATKATFEFATGPAGDWISGVISDLGA